MSYKDLREFIEQTKELGDCRLIEGADAYLEIGSVTEVAAGLPECPAVLFDNIKGYPPGFRVFTNAIMTPRRAGLALGIDPKLNAVEILKVWMQKRRTLPRLPPKMVESAAFSENSFSGDAVDLARFPVPYWHRQDGGPYIGTGALCVMRDPDEGWINASIYRVQMHSKNQVTIQFDHSGRHGAIIAQKYWNQDKACPVAIITGIDPALFIAGFEFLPSGYSEYDFAGSIKGTAIEACEGPATGLPIPAHAEIVIEGELLPSTKLSLDEGPFGEFTGYYAAEKRPCPVMNVRAVHHRNDPILLGSPPLKPPYRHMGLPFRSAAIWDNLDSSGVTDVVGVWQHVSSFMIVISLKQRYDGHAQRAALIAAAQAYMARFIVVVDDDIDPSNLDDVMWAIATRCEPSESIDIIRSGWSSTLDPRIPPDKKLRGETAHSKALILACRPFSWSDKFPAVNALSQAEARETQAKWQLALRPHNERPKSS